MEFVEVSDVAGFDPPKDNPPRLVSSLASSMTASGDGAASTLEDSGGDGLAKAEEPNTEGACDAALKPNPVEPNDDVFEANPPKPGLAWNADGCVVELVPWPNDEEPKEGAANWPKADFCSCWMVDVVLGVG